MDLRRPRSLELPAWVQRYELATVLGVGLALAVVVWWWTDGEPGAVLGALGFSALLFGAIQFRDAKGTMTGLKQIGHQLRESTESLEQQLSTRRVGVFPGFMPRIVELLRRAGKTIVIFCDFPAYGDFSSPHYSEYAATIKGSGARISLLCLGEGERRKLVDNQIPGVGWEAWRDEHAEELRAYLGRLPADPTVDHETIGHRRLLKILDERDALSLKDEFAKADVRMTDQVMPLYFWIADGEEAIFSLAPLLQDGALEVGFRTTDPDMIKALQDIFERYRQSAKRH